MKKLSFILLFALTGCARNVGYIKDHSTERAKAMGYSIAAYEGYEWSVLGGQVWYQMKRDDSPGIIYNGFFQRWGDELQLYDIKVLSGNQIQLNQ